MIQLGLIGYPLSHSLSPKIHTAALAACKLEGRYSLFPLQPDDGQALKDLFDKVRSGEITGLNVTVPHKQNALEFLDEFSPFAEAIGAVNTVYLRGNKLVGDNTDAAGFLKDIKQTFDFSSSGSRSALVLGAGGSARAIVYALANEGWSVEVTSRRLEQARQLADSFANSKAVEFDTVISKPSSFQLIINATPLGMLPNVDESPLPQNVLLSKDTIVYDLVYNPSETKLVRDVRAQGLTATTGLGMLIEQAALAFELWTGRNPPRDVLWKAVEN